ncbi:hypothetical protein [Bosea sp. ANAM02]|uniref:hypothetical protein n=1 Tax=Bosea sp. ANAM02 TaxID=2020412 RepID=UPI00140F21FF|nr:hypothetical protein [Bosea sp. ANAM02]BCB21940.1 hypothetical protein OCUBac02_48340 [Bosea sp. ANAM02]
MNDLRKLDDVATFELIRERWFRGCPSVRIDIRTEGVEHDYDARIVTLGCRAGPSYEVGNLLHEMAHLIEIPEHRAVERNFGLKFGTPFLSRAGVQRLATSYQATLRETRVWSWQFAVMRDLGLNPDIDDLVRPAAWISDFENVPGRDQTEKLRFLADVVLSGARGRTLAMFDETWRLRLDRLPDLFRERQEREDRIRAAFAGDCIRESVYRMAGTDASNGVKLKTWTDGETVVHEVFAEMDDGTLEEVLITFDEAEADRYARRLFGGCDVEVSINPDLEPANSAPTLR